jgi:diadenosine tetraphosphate (Ap4A) HIT family hydrolase
MPAQQPTLKKLAVASGATDYNILQNNGTIAHQQVHHVSLTAIFRFQGEYKANFE